MTLNLQRGSPDVLEDQRCDLGALVLGQPLVRALEYLQRADVGGRVGPEVTFVPKDLPHDLRTIDGPNAEWPNPLVDGRREPQS
jgi:hypothetical protein